MTDDDIEVSLELLYECIVDELQLRNQPRIHWVPDNEIRGFDGMYFRNTHEIKIAERLKGQTEEFLNHLITHELTHWLMNEAGYRSIGHGWQFLAAYALLLHRLGIGGDKYIEDCICKNWSKWSPRSIRHRHFTQARQVYSAVSQQDNFNNFNGIQIADAVFAEDIKLHPLINSTYRFILHRSHNVFADTRGHKLVRLYIAIGFIIAGFILLRSGFLTFGMIFIAAGALLIDVNGNVLGKQIKQN